VIDVMNESIFTSTQQPAVIPTRLPTLDTAARQVQSLFLLHSVFQVKKLKTMYSCLCEIHCRAAEHHLSYGITCYPTQVNAPRFYPKYPKYPASTPNNNTPNIKQPDIVAVLAPIIMGVLCSTPKPAGQMTFTYTSITNKTFVSRSVLQTKLGVLSENLGVLSTSEAPLVKQSNSIYLPRKDGRLS